MYAHGFLAVEQRVRDTPDLAEHHVRNGPGIAVLLECADVETDGLLDDVVLAVGDEERPVGEVDDRGHDYDAGEEGGVVEELAWQTDQGGDVFGRGEAFGGVDLPRLGGEEDLSWLHADVYAFHSAEA